MARTIGAVDGRRTCVDCDLSEGSFKAHVHRASYSTLYDRFTGRGNDDAITMAICIARALVVNRRVGGLGRNSDGL